MTLKHEAERNGIAYKNPKASQYCISNADNDGITDSLDSTDIPQDDGIGIQKAILRDTESYTSKIFDIYRWETQAWNRITRLRIG